MSKIKKKIPHKIIWDRTEKVSHPRPHHPSPHLLDLRTHQHATARSSAVGRWVARVQERLGVVARAHHLRLPSVLRRSTASLHHAIEFLHHSPSLAFRFARAHPRLSKTAIGTVVVAFVAIVAWVVRAPFRATAAPERQRPSFVQRSLWPVRWFVSTVKYWIRRGRLFIELWLPDREVLGLSIPQRTVLRVHTEDGPLFSRHQRALAVFVCFAFVIILPLQFLSSAALPSMDQLTAEGSEMVDTLMQALTAMEAGEWEAADRAWLAVQQQSDALGNAVYLRNPIVRGVGELVSNDFRSGYAMVELIQEASSLGRQFTLMGATLQASLSLSERVERVRIPLQQARASFGEIVDLLQNIDSAIVPDRFRSSFDTVTNRAPDMLALFDRFLRMSELAPTLLGAARPVRYLVVFQNDSELRPSGGFIGSLAVVDVHRGEIKKTFVPGGGSYDLQGSLRTNIQSPLPLQHVNARWEFQDANWWSDFPTTAKKLLWFWEESGGPTVDGVIAVNASLVERLLSLTGPIALPEYDKVITAENFYDETHRAVEVEYDRVENTPKRFIADLVDALLLRVSENGSGLTTPMLFTMLDAIDRKDMMVAFRDPVVQAQNATAGMDGALAPLDPFEDGVHLVIANIGGEKTDRVTQDALRHEVVVDDDTRSLNATVTLTRVHRGVAGVPLTGVRNRSYLRFYLPIGSSILSTEGFMLPTRPRELPLEEYERDPDLAAFETAEQRRDRTNVFTELDRTVVGGWMELDPGEVHTVQVTYRLPWTVDELPNALYRMRFQRQSGYARATVEHATVASDRWVIEPRDGETGPRPFTHDERFTDVVQAR